MLPVLKKYVMTLIGKRDFSSHRQYRIAMKAGGKLTFRSIIKGRLREREMCEEGNTNRC